MLSSVIEIARKAGEEILRVYGESFGVSYKEDRSPLTDADRNSNTVITGELSRLFADIPVISEEDALAPYEARKKFRRFWLIDPLDGTKEFIKRNGEFTVNIALIEERVSVLGVVYAPAKGLLYYAAKGEGAYKVSGGGSPIRLPRRELVEGEIRVVSSRSHPSPRAEEYLKRFRIKENVHAGSSLKFCVVAEGGADLYPRFGETTEWDTAAGQCVAEEAGVLVVGLDGERLIYNKESLIQPGFIVSALKHLPEV